MSNDYDYEIDDILFDILNYTPSIAIEFNVATSMFTIYSENKESACALESINALKKLLDILKNQWTQDDEIDLQKVFIKEVSNFVQSLDPIILKISETLKAKNVD